MSIRYAHTNIVAKDWRKLAEFYTKVLDCEPVPPERDYEGGGIGKIAGIPYEQSKILKGQHLRLPGHGPEGPTLEIFQYGPEGPKFDIQSNTMGFSHIAFVVDDVKAVAEQFIEWGGKELGEYTEMDVEGAGHIVLQYLSDPEGNIVELQTWTPLGG